MNAKAASTRPLVELRKYPNRRYYDSQRSCHVTLEEIYEMIRSGAEVRVTDSKTAEDITAKVLAQIILEHDPPKLGILPVELLHQLIRANEPLIREFVDKYFSQALLVFLESQRQFDRYLRQSMGLDAAGAPWAKMMMAPLRSMWYGAGTTPASATPPTEKAPPAPDGDPAPAPPAADAASGELLQQLDDLRRQLAAVQQQLLRHGNGDQPRARSKRAARRRSDE